MARVVNNSPNPRIEYGFLMLRIMALLLFVTVGSDKLLALLSGLRAGKPLGAIGVAPLIAKMGFPFPALCGLYVVLNESVGALFIAFGLFTRVAAACAALSMTGAFYTALRFGWEPLRAFAFLFIFVALAVAGAGRLSLDSRYLKSQPIIWSLDAGILVVRAGLLIFFVLLFALDKGNATGSFAVGPAVILIFVVATLAAFAILGYCTRLVSIISCIFWGLGTVSGLLTGQKWDILPYRDAMLFLLFIALALAGPGRFSLGSSRRG
jgi:putative oxidoreductase